MLALFPSDGVSGLQGEDPQRSVPADNVGASMPSGTQCYPQAEKSRGAQCCCLLGPLLLGSPDLILKALVDAVCGPASRERIVVVAGDKSGQLAIWNVHPRQEDYQAPALVEDAGGSAIRKSIERKEEEGNEGEEAGDGCQGLHTFLVHDSVVSGLAIPAWDHHASAVQLSLGHAILVICSAQAEHS